MSATEVPQDRNSLEEEFAKKSFDSAREEIANRMRLRDQTLAAYFTGLITSVGYVLVRNETAKHGAADLLLFLPFFSLTVAHLIAENHDIVGALAMYQAVELGDWLAAARTRPLPLWERSQASLNRKTSGSHEAVSWNYSFRADSTLMTELAVICLPPVCVLALWAESVYGEIHLLSKSFSSICHLGALALDSWCIYYAIKLIRSAAVLRRERRMKLCEVLGFDSKRADADFSELGDPVPQMARAAGAE